MELLGLNGTYDFALGSGGDFALYGVFTEAEGAEAGRCEHYCGVGLDGGVHGLCVALEVVVFTGGILLGEFGGLLVGEYASAEGILDFGSVGRTVFSFVDIFERYYEVVVLVSNILDTCPAFAPIVHLTA